MTGREFESFQHVRYSWEDAVAARLDPVERLVYRSNLLGGDQRITNTGGGNTSSKLDETDPLTGKPVRVLWVKGSGGDLRTAKRDLFSSLYLDRVVGLESRYISTSPRGPKTPIEDSMVGAYSHCTFNLNPRATSIDTPLHAFVPAAHVDHTHPNAVIAIAASARGPDLTREIYGDEVIWTPWQRPGFDLGLLLAKVCREHPKAKGVILGQHGLINWADDDKACYELSLRLIEKAARFLAARDKGDAAFGGRKVAPLAPSKREDVLAAILPALRGLVSVQKRMIATVETEGDVLDFVCSADAPRLAELGTSCPDHFLRTKIKPMFVPWDAASESVEILLTRLRDGIVKYRADYAAYYARCKRADSPAMRDASPTVVLIPGVGMVAWGKDKSESRVTAEFYRCAIAVMRGAEAVDRYISLPEQEAFDIEYWLLEEAKLKRMPAEQEFARKIVLVVGAGNGIGRATAERLAAEGAHVVCADLDAAAATETANSILARRGQGIGVSGTGISGCGPAFAAPVDITRRESVASLIRTITLAYGGLDSVAVTAGIYPPVDLQGNTTEPMWAKAFEVNVTGAFLVADEAKRLWSAQGGLRGSLVLTTSVNGVVSKRGSLAYDASKAAANHLVRELAIDLAPGVRVNGVAPATVVEGSTMFPRDRVMASLAKYSIAFDQAETTESLRSKLAGFYAQRTLTKLPITPADQAEAIWFLLSDRSAKTTGQIIHVDGGLAEAFMR